MKMRPTNDYVTIKPEYEKVIDGIAVPDEYVEMAAPAGFDGRPRPNNRIALSSRTAVGVVVGWGPGVSDKDDDGHWTQRHPIDDLEVGDRVLFERTASAYLPDGETVIVRHEAVWAVLDPSLDVQTTQV